MSSGLTIRIINFPPGSTFNRGSPSGQFWVLTQSDFGEIELFLPEHSSGRFEITAEALYAYSSHGRVGTVQFTVQPVADVPNLTVTHSPCIDSGSVIFSISSSLVDSDGSETLVVVVAGLPSGSQLSAGHVSEEGDYILDVADLQRSIMATIPPTSLGNISIIFTATAAETLSNSTASTNTTISLSKCQEGTSHLSCSWFNNHSNIISWKHSMAALLKLMSPGTLNGLTLNEVLPVLSCVQEVKLPLVYCNNFAYTLSVYLTCRNCNAYM